MMQPVADLREPLAVARRYAALSGPFPPLDALRAAPLKGQGDVAAVASLLASACDTNPAEAEGCWLLRTPERHHELKLLADPKTLKKAIAWRRRHGIDPAADDLHAVLRDRLPLSRAAIERVLTGGQDRALLERIVVALDWAGPIAPAHDLLPAVRSAIAALDQCNRLRTSSARGFVGRLAERGQIAAWLENPITRPPVTCLYIKGAPSIGKSSLLTETVGAFHQGCQPLILRFDFDWPGLDVQDQLGFTMEAARQLAQQLGKGSAILLEARLEAAVLPGGAPEPNASRRALFPTELAAAMAKAATASGRPPLVVLDTLEVLRGRGETHPQRLFDWLDSLVAAGLSPLRVVAAGRGDALDGCPGRVTESMPLSGLDDATAGELLDRLAVPPALRPDLVTLADGNPLKLRLGAEIVVGGEAARLRPSARRRRKAVSAAFLYRFLLSRIEDPDLRRIVNPGLIVRRISAELIYDVLAPRMRLRRITRGRAEALMQALGSLHWLVEPDPAAPGFLRHRADMRAMLLPLLYASAPKLCAAVNDGAARWFAKRREPWCLAEAAYHRLQLLRMRDGAPEVDWESATQLSPEMIGELPQAARDAVHAARGERSGRLRADAPVVGDDAAFSEELLGILKRRDWREGRHLVDRVLASDSLDPASPAADTVRAFLWRAGAWRGALSLLRDRDRVRWGDDDLDSLPAPVALARLEMRAEFAPRAFLNQFRHKRPVNADVYRAAVAASDNLARQGAMAFLMASQPNRRPFAEHDTPEADPVEAARGLWAGGDQRQLRRALLIAQERFDRYLGTAHAIGDVPEPRFLAALTPYAAVAGTLIATGGRQQLLHHACAVLTNLEQRTSGPLEEVALDSITGLGEFAEWAGAAAFVTRDPDLRLIGRAAERWRRTMAGDWRYGPHPRGWSAQYVDTTVDRRIKRLLDERNPRAASLAQLGLWFATDPAVAEGELRQRLHGTLAGVASWWYGDAKAIARRLLSRYVPTAFVPPLSVLFSTERA